MTKLYYDDETRHLIIREGKLKYKNFSGEKFRDKKRSVSIEIPEEYVNDLIDDHWNVKSSVDSNNQKTYYINVNINYNHEKNIEPDIFSCDEEIGENGKRRCFRLSEANVGKLDRRIIKYVNVDLYPRRSIDDVTGEPQVKGYVQSLYAIIKKRVFEDEFEIYDSNEPVATDEEELPFN